jgi:hypothetical protein
MSAFPPEPDHDDEGATADTCEGGLPVVDYRVADKWSTPVSVEAWWVADASVYGIAGTHQLGPAPDSEAGSFRLPLAFYATVTVYASQSGGRGLESLLGLQSSRSEGISGQC